MLFPGQGAQFVGMGAGFFPDCAASARILDRASDVLGLDLAKLCLEGPEEELARTEICQPAILATSLAILSTMNEDLDRLRDCFAATAGLSLGEYSALVFAGALRLEDALEIVRRRGRYMQECSDKYPSGMVSLLGADEETAERICERAREHGIAGLANLNGAGQIVVSGDRAAMAAVLEVAPEFGVRRSLPLKVSGAFHSERMREASDRLREDLRSIEIREPAITFLSNVTGSPLRDPEEIRRCLGEQVVRPVLWERSILSMVDSGIEQFVEPGPGKVLTGLARKIHRSASTLSISTPEEAASATEELQPCSSGSEGGGA
jgi:[acyl-carrier-protein] S-malonyltransferase